MKKEDIPQDKSALDNFTREVCYVKNNTGKYKTGLSIGWDIKKDALDNAWDEVNRRIEDARNAVKEGRKSPIYFFKELNLMSISILSGYTGFRKFSVKRHIKPGIFNKLSDKKLDIYARAFDISIDELKNFKG